MTELDELTPAERELALALQRELRATEDLDFVTASRLRAARARALAAAAPRDRSRWLTAGGVTATALLVAVLAFNLRTGLHNGVQEPGSGPVETLEVMTDEMDTEFYEDLDLYEWLAHGPDGHV